MHHVDGLIGYVGLGQWWLTEFTPDERRRIESVFRPMGTKPRSRPLTQGQVGSSSHTATRLLTDLLSWFKKPGTDDAIGGKIAAKLAECAHAGPPILDRHFAYQAIGEWYYRHREPDPAALNRAIWAYEQQIALAPSAAAAFRREFDGDLPAHSGYRQLTAVWAKQGALATAIQLCEQADLQGWRGDWQRRMERYRKKLERDS